MIYKNAVCDGCGQPFEDGDDIVVCPECGTPQHRECYNKRNSCVNAYLHSGGYVWEAPAPEKLEPAPQQIQQEANTVPVLPNQSVSAFEAACMFGVDAKAEDEFNGVRVKDAAIYVQHNARKYINKYVRNKDKKHSVTWNWGAFFFGPCWFFFRKLYKLGALFLAVTVALNISLSSYIFNVHGAEFEKFMTAYEELYDLRYKNDKTPEEQEHYNALAVSMAETANKLTPYISAYIAGCFLLPGIAAALLADGQYKKRIMTDIAFARKAMPDPYVFERSIAARGGVSMFAGGLGLMAQLYLPQIILSAINMFIN